MFLNSLLVNTIQSENYESEAHAIKVRPDGQIIQHILNTTQTGKKQGPRSKMEKHKQIHHDRINMMSNDPRHITSYNLSQKNNMNRHNQFNQNFNY